MERPGGGREGPRHRDAVEGTVTRSEDPDVPRDLGPLPKFPGALVSSASPRCQGENGAFNLFFQHSAPGPCPPKHGSGEPSLSWPERPEGTRTQDTASWEPPSAPRVLSCPRPTASGCTCGPDPLATRQVLGRRPASWGASSPLVRPPPCVTGGEAPRSGGFGSLAPRADAGAKLLSARSRAPCEAGPDGWACTRLVPPRPSRQLQRGVGVLSQPRDPRCDWVQYKTAQ